MITKLSKKQEAAIPRVRDEWLAKGLQTGACDRPACEAAVDLAYRCAGLIPPAIKIWLLSPMQGVLTAAALTQVWDQVQAQVGDQVWDQVQAQVGDQVWDQVWGQVRDQVQAQVWDQVGDQVRDQIYKCGYGQHDADWLGFYAFFSTECGLQLDAFDGLWGMASCGWWWPFKGLVILTERPTHLYRDDQHRLHCRERLALEYPDGGGIAAWHGVRLPAAWVQQEPDVQLCLTWQNAEQRRCLCEMIGWDRVGELVGARCIHEDSYGRLMEIPASPATGGAPGRFVEVVNPTDGRKFWIPVPRETERARQAVAWTYAMTENEYAPLVRT